MHKAAKLVLLAFHVSRYDVHVPIKCSKELIIIPCKSSFAVVFR